MQQTEVDALALWAAKPGRCVTMRLVSGAWLVSLTESFELLGTQAFASGSAIDSDLRCAIRLSIDRIRDDRAREQARVLEGVY